MNFSKQTIKVVGIGGNLPVPYALMHLSNLGLYSTKIENPAGDLLKQHFPEWYKKIHENINVLELDIVKDIQTARKILLEADAILCSLKISFLQKYQLSPEELIVQKKDLVFVHLSSEDAANDRPLHDLNCQLENGLLNPPNMPNHLAVDVVAGYNLAMHCLSQMLRSKNSAGANISYLSMQDGAKQLAESKKFGATTGDGLLGGANAYYSLYPTSDGWLSMAFLEKKFIDSFEKVLGRTDRSELEQLIKKESCKYWESLAKKHHWPMTCILTN